MTKFLKQHAGALIFSVLLHLVLIGLLGVTLNLSLPKRAPPRLSIEAVVVDSSILTAKQRQQDELQRQREADARRQRERKAAEDKRQQELLAKREAEEQARQQSQAEEKRKTEEAAKRKAAEDKRKAEEAAKRKAAEDKRKAEEAAKRKAAEDKRKAEEAAKRKAEEAAKRKLEQQRQREEAELRAAMQAEEELLALQQSDAMNQYQWQIQQRIERSWIRPPSARVGLSCELVVIQLPSGDVIDVRVGRCNGDDVVIRSLEAAVLRASPLPEPPDPRLYSRNLTILFEPEQ